MNPEERSFVTRSDAAKVAKYMARTLHEKGLRDFLAENLEKAYLLDKELFLSHLEEYNDREETNEGNS